MGDDTHTPITCHGCGRSFATARGLGIHRRHCKGPVEDKPKGKRKYTHSPASRRQRKLAPRKHGERAASEFADTPCTDDACQAEDGRPCEFRDGVLEQGGDNAVCWPEALGLDPDRRVRLDQLTDTFEQGLDNPLVLDRIKARGFALTTDTLHELVDTAVKQGLIQESEVLLYEDEDGKQVLGLRRSVHPGARFAFTVLAKNLGITADAERTTRKAHKGALGKQAEDPYDAALMARRSLMEDGR